MFRVPVGTEMTPKLLGEFIQRHKQEKGKRYQKLQDAYKNKYEIQDFPDKPKWKPDNRISVNFAKYIVDTMNGFFIGIPIKSFSDDKNVSDYLEFLDQYNDQDDNNAELSKICSIYGKGHEMYYVDDSGNIGITYLTPMESFFIYDESIVENPLFFVRYYKNSDNVEMGSWSDEKIVQHFKKAGEYQWTDKPKQHGFDGVPAAEFIENEERIGIFESALPMINAYNKAISEKANAVDYFADAYLKILGTELDEEGVKNIRDNRIINFDGDTEKLIVEFLQKPDGDVAQENLINRLEKLIFQISMVANISDENFGTSSGIALKYKLQAMSNLAKTKERKFVAGMNRRYRLIFSNPISTEVNKDSWTSIKYLFTRNYPANVLEESQIAQNLDSVVSKETQLSVLSIVDSVQEEIKKLENEQEGLENDVVMKRMFEKDEQNFGAIDDEAAVQGKQLNGAQT